MLFCEKFLWNFIFFCEDPPPPLGGKSGYATVFDSIRKKMQKLLSHKIQSSLKDIYNNQKNTNSLKSKKIQKFAIGTQFLFNTILWKFSFFFQNLATKLCRGYWKTNVINAGLFSTAQEIFSYLIHLVNLSLFLSWSRLTRQKFGRKIVQLPTAERKEKKISTDRHHVASFSTLVVRITTVGSHTYQRILFFILIKNSYTVWWIC